MTLNQLNTLTDDELGIALYIVNHISPPIIPPPPFEPRNLTWWKHQALVQIFIDAFPQIKPEGHPIYTSLMEKLGIKIEIKETPPVPPPVPPPQQPESSSNASPNPDMPEIFNQMPTGSI